MFFNPEIIRVLRNENFKQIEDIIDARKLLGQYNIYKPNYHVRYVYSASSPSNRTVKFDESSMVSSTEKDEGVSGPSSAVVLKHTDSEVTVVRVKCSRSSVIKCKLNDKWDMLDDIAIPGDGTHLADSPSLVNLATLVAKNMHQCEGDDEYLVPLSSWDPLFRNEDLQAEINKCCSESKISEKYSLRVTSTDPDLIHRMEDLNNSNSSQTEIRSDDFLLPYRREVWACRMPKYVRKTIRKS